MNPPVPVVAALASEVAGGAATRLAVERPMALGGLVLPLVLLLLARLLARPDRRATGALRLWRRLAATEPRSARSTRPGVPLPLWLLAGALTSAALAGAGPRLVARPPGRLWRVVVDRSPGLFLPFGPRRERASLAHLDGTRPLGPARLPRADAGAARRIEVALDAALDELRHRWRPGDRVEWRSPGRETLEREEPEAPPTEWLAPEAPPAARPDFAAHDAPGRLLVTDRAVPVRRAGLFASGGEAVPGLVGRRGARRVEWDGGEACREVAGEPRAVALAPDVTGAVERMAETWAGARGFALVRARPRPGEPDGDRALELFVASGPLSAEPVEVGRDGWKLAVLPVASSDAGAGEPWLEHGGRALVQVAPGRVRLAFGEAPGAGRPAGDPARFAVSWAELFDRAVLPEPGAVAIEARLAAGEPVRRSGEPPPREGEPSPPVRIDVALALVAAALAAGGALAGRAPGQAASGSDSSGSSSSTRP